ncbi:MAG TPA: class I SAM-dependent methyltransferase [Isosphaeraceae bacterium]|jgi:predicted O-methyltransferase YrrM|nr:class I SAM-dependent methyltransferase [Isosphaeraceae bacterium]
MGIRTATRDLIAQLVVRAVPPGIFRDKRYFRLWQSRGYHVTRVHFYEPIPDTVSLKDDLWARPSAMVGVDMRVEAQLELLAAFAERYKSEYEGVDPITRGTPDWEALYCVVRHFRPRRIIEIGSGVSTRVAALAVEENRRHGVDARLTAIEPYPSDELRAGFPGLSDLKVTQVQDVPLSEFEALGENDILFIDSSHVLKLGSDVQYEFLEILPRLRPGVVAHVHDIFFPFEYRRDWPMEQSIFWNEQYLLQAFLAFNSAFEVLLSNSYIHHAHPDALRRAFDRYDPKVHHPGSFWMRRKLGP